MSKTLTTFKIVATVAIAVALIFGATFAVSTVQAKALTLSELVELFIALEIIPADKADAARAALSQQTGGSSSTGANCTTFTFTRNHSTGDSGGEVMEIQKFLNAHGIAVATAGSLGSAGNETSYFGPATHAAAVKFQDMYASEILTPLGLSGGTGFWGASSRAKANAFNANCGDTDTVVDGDDDTTDDDVPAGTSMVVSAAAQPANSLAPANAARVPFTKFTLTNNSSGPVSFDDITVELKGLMEDGAFSGVILVDDSTGLQIGDSNTFNANDQATIGEKTTLQVGESKTFTVAGNMDSSLSTEDGQTGRIELISIDTDVALSGSLPIAGATHTANNSLSLGSVTAQRGALDPNADLSPEVGSTAQTWSAVKLTAGSTEDLTLQSVRWNQTGSVSTSDLENTVVIVDGTEYPVTVSVDGDHYSASFNGGIVIEKGLSKELSIKGDVTDGANRTVNFDLENDYDVYVVGNTFDYGITPTIGGNNDANTSSDDSEFNDGTNDGGTPPWYDGQKHSVGTGTLTIASSAAVPAGNVAVGANEVNLGAFKFTVRGEAIKWTSIKFDTSTSTSAADTELTNVTLVDADGNIVAGPADMSKADGTITLSDNVTLASGDHTLFVKGNLNNNWANNDTIQIQLGTANITNLKGEVTNTTITPTPSSTTVSAKTQTLSGASLAVSPSGSLVSQNIMVNQNDIILGRYVLDATGSGEDLRVSVAKFEATVNANGDVDDFNTLQIQKTDGTRLNTGSNILDPSSNAIGADPTLTLTMDGSGFVVPKGTSMIVELVGNNATSSVSSSNAPTYSFDFRTGISNGDWTVTGVDTGTEITETFVTTNHATMTVVNSGTLTSAIASNDPVEKWYIAGEEAVVGIFDFTSTNEQIEITDFDLILGAASSAPADIARLSFWDDSTELFGVNSPAFTNDNDSFDFDNAGADFITPADGSKDLTVRVKFAAVGNNLSGTSGNLVEVGTSSVAANNQARGLESGATINIDGSAGSTTGARYFRALPEFAIGTTPTNKLQNAEVELYDFTVKAIGDDVGIYKFTFNVATTNASTASFKLTEKTTGKVVRQSVNDLGNNSNNLEITVATTTYGTGYITIPEGQTYHYELEATLSNLNGDADQGGAQITTKLLGDEAYAPLLNTEGAASGLANAFVVDATSEDDFIWSPFSTTTGSNRTTLNEDWVNGYRVRGLEFDDLDSVSLVD